MINLIQRYRKGELEENNCIFKQILKFLFPCLQINESKKTKNKPLFSWILYSSNLTISSRAQIMYEKNSE